MTIPAVLQALAALAFTLGLFGLGVWALRRFGPNLMKRLQSAPGSVRRMRVVETLVLGPQQRLLLVQVDGDERVVLLGQGQLDAAVVRKAKP